MSERSHRKLWVLYLLALFQLAAGPFVILVTVQFCHLALPEIPRYGTVAAIEKAWTSEKFQTTLCEASVLTSGKKSPLPDQNPHDPSAKVKMPPIPWKETRFLSLNHPQLLPQVEIERVWTPAWPQAPPGPPPRVG